MMHLELERVAISQHAQQFNGSCRMRKCKLDSSYTACICIGGILAFCVDIIYKPLKNYECIKCSFLNSQHT